MGDSQNNWGWKATVHIYIEGDITDGQIPGDDLDELTNLLNDAVDRLPEFTEGRQKVDFMGMAVEEVKDEPKDQIGT